MCELKFKKQMNHLLQINTELYKENQVLKKALSFKEQEVYDLEKYVRSCDENLYRLNQIITKIKSNE